ncbi:MAG: hypothetical protein KJZ69_05460 [Phycisphaerales bacterium]|nr:hypothetical protein [Phycisphaerales bacterium]
MFRNSHLLSPIAASFILVMSAATDVGAQDYRYALFDLPSLIHEDQFTGGAGISSSGNVVGFAAIDQVEFHGVLWPSTGNIIDLGTLGGDSSSAVVINDIGEIAGWSNFEPGGSVFVRHAVIWRGMEMIDLGTLGGESSFANGMNNVGQVVGQSEIEWGRFNGRAFLWESGVMQELPRLCECSDSSYGANDINDAGEIVGTNPSPVGPIAVLWVNGKVFDLGSLSGNGSQAHAINEQGVIVGYSVAANGQGHAVKWVDRQIIDIHSPLIIPPSFARDINNVGQIVGDAVGYTRGFILNPGEQMILLDDLVPPRLRLPWWINRATSINDAGQIAAEAKVPGRPSDYWAVLLSPVETTMTMRSPQPGRAGEANRLRVTGVTPGARVVFLYSRHGGGERIPGCDLQQNALQLDSPTVIGTAIADANGVATITRTVPPIAQGQTILFQAVVQNECAISQLVVHRFE